jgi:hypothetical protein
MIPILLTIGGAEIKSNFLVEEFVSSDPVYVPHLKNKPYDGTLRVIALVAYDQLETSVQFIESYWKLPPKSLNEKGTLNQKHKSFAGAPNFSFVSEEINTVVEQQLSEAILKLYEKLLTHYGIESILHCI